MTKAEKAAEIMEQWAIDDSHGYDQEYRWGQYGDYDCSSAVITAWELAGVPVKTCGATTTWTMLPIFLAMGFEDIIDSVDVATGAGLQRGDILLNRQNHVAMYCGDNHMEVEASLNENGGIIGGQPGDQTGWEFLIRPYRNYPWDHVLRYTKDEEVYHMDLLPVRLGDNGRSVLVCQKMLACCGLYSGTFDGAAGTKTAQAIIDFQLIIAAEGVEIKEYGLCDEITWKELVDRRS